MFFDAQLRKGEEEEGGNGSCCRNPAYWLRTHLPVATTATMMHIET